MLFGLLPDRATDTPPRQPRARSSAEGFISADSGTNRPYAPSTLAWVDDYPATPAARDHDNEARRLGLTREQYSEQLRQARLEAESRRPEVVEARRQDALDNAVRNAVATAERSTRHQRWHQEGRDAFVAGRCASALLSEGDGYGGMCFAIADGHRLAGFLDAMRDKLASL